MYGNLISASRSEYRRIPVIFSLIKWTLRGVHADRTLHILYLGRVGTTRIMLHGVTARAREHVLGLNAYHLSS